jgi:mannosyltransferase OCH1-like enzyme
MKTVKSIPPIIHLLAKDKNVTGVYKRFYDGIKQLHPHWDVRVYDDKDITKFIGTYFSEFRNSFNTYPYNIQRLDLARVLLIYKYGGFYMDMDIHCKRPLDELRSHGIIFAIEKLLTAQEMKLPYHKYPERIANYMFGSIEGHPFLYSFAEHITRNASFLINDENDILESTGPGVLTNFYHENKFDYGDIFLLKNEHYHCEKRCSVQPSCHFGNYAAHVHLGSWRWQ